MENRSHALMTGFFTIALLVAAVLVGLWLNRDRTETHPYEIVTTQTIPGLNPQATVRYRGLEIGRVDDIVFDPKVTGQILIKLSIDEGAPVTTTTFATLGYQGVTGIAFIQLDDERTGSPLLNSDNGSVKRIPLRPGLLDQLEKRGLAILEKTERITERVNDVLSKENTDKLSGAIDNIGKAAEAYAAIPQQLQPTLARLPALEAKFDQTMGSVKGAADSIQNTANNYNRLADSLQAPGGPIERAATAIDSLGGVTSDLELHTLPHVVEMADEAKTSLRAVRRTVNGLGDRPQSILFGAPTPEPGPGEPGFVPPTK
ncbi:MlaD family protein [Massilia sp. YIM B02763]|uniref:MlaD family protein n=1 Tax=Massilia sp. YIM B02763 TaxID=3050130 RepID=UPI0025B6B329|nr:MlaD family protein [Massilia sp. YIM B02763]MDN4053479.1 MlaD family protein [Massilia sp. YIM B02763]